MRPHVPERVPPPKAQRHLDLLSELLGAGTVGLVDDEQIGHLHHPGLERLDPVARLGHQDEHGDVRHPRDVELGLPHAHGLDQDPVEPRGVEQIAHLPGGGGEPAERPPASHGADVDTLIEGDGFHPDAVAEERAAGERAGGVHGHDGHAEPCLPVGGDQAFHEGRFAGAGRAGDTDAASPAEGAVHVREEALEPGPSILDHRNRSGQGGGLAGLEAREQEVGIHERKVA